MYGRHIFAGLMLMALSDRCHMDKSTFFDQSRFNDAGTSNRFNVTSGTAPSSRPPIWTEKVYTNALALYSKFENYNEHKLASNDSLELYDGLPAIPRSKLQRAIDVVSDALRVYGLDGTAASFNGGKDATVVLLIYITTLASFYDKHHIPVENRSRPKAVYFADESEFPAVKEFVHQVKVQWDLDLLIYRGAYMDRIGDCLNDMEIQNQSLPQQQHVYSWHRHPLFLIGKRRSDPKSSHTGIWEPSSGWLKTRPFMRAHPILEWSYGEVWFLLTYFNINYCRLYDEGYTSLGRIRETERNELLRTEDGWTSARSLKNWSSERGGRNGENDQDDDDDIDDDDIDDDVVRQTPRSAN